MYLNNLYYTASITKKSWDCLQDKCVEDKLIHNKNNFLNFDSIFEREFTKDLTEISK